MYGTVAYILLACAAPAIWYNDHKNGFCHINFWKKNALIRFAHEIFELRSFFNHQDKNERRSCFARHFVSALTSARSMNGALELVANEHFFFRNSYFFEKVGGEKSQPWRKLYILIYSLSPWDWSIISILEPSFDMTLFHYFWRFAQICKKFAAFARKIVFVIFSVVKLCRSNNKNNFVSEFYKFLANLCES